MLFLIDTIFIKKKGQRKKRKVGHGNRFLQLPLLNNLNSSPRGWTSSFSSLTLNSKAGREGGSSGVVVVEVVKIVKK